jgi:hypothetical protein
MQSSQHVNTTSLTFRQQPMMVKKFLSFLPPPTILQKANACLPCPTTSILVVSPQELVTNLAIQVIIILLVIIEDMLCQRFCRLHRPQQHMMVLPAWRLFMIYDEINSDNTRRHCVIPRIAGLAITLNYH